MPNYPSLGHRTDIQGLRAVAVLLVLAAHAGIPYFAGGYIGVDVFFVISGFLITSLLFKEYTKTGSISLSGFFSRRARRILPVSGVVLITTLIASWLWFPITQINSVLKDAFTAVAYFVNYRFAAESVEYLNADALPSPFQQYWSLAVEEQFYLFWPLLLLGMLALARKLEVAPLYPTLAALMLLFLFSLSYSVVQTNTSEPFAYFGTHTRIWELLVGAFLALTLRWWTRIPIVLAHIMAPVGLAAVIYSAVRFTESTAFPGYHALLPVFGTALVIAAGARTASTTAGYLLKLPPMQYVGKISYSLYLWHWPVLIILPFAVGVPAGLALNLTLLIVAFALSHLSYHYVEQPLRSPKRWRESQMYGLLVGVSVTMASVATLVVFIVVIPTGDDTSNLEHADSAVDENESQKRIEEALSITEVPDNLTPSLATVTDDKPIIYDDDCHLGFDDTQLPSGCAYGDTDSEKVMYLIGDSHAAQWFPALNNIADSSEWKLVNRTKSSCTPSNLDSYLAVQERPYDECLKWRQNIFDEVADTKPDMIIFGSTETNQVVGVDGTATTEWLEGWRSTISEVKNHTSKLVYIQDTPFFPSRVPDCIAQNDNVADCNGERSEVLRMEDRRQYTAELFSNADGKAIDTSEWLCTNEICPVIADNLLVYRDAHHMSVPFVLTLTDLLESELPDLN